MIIELKNVKTGIIGFKYLFLLGFCKANDIN